MKNDFKLSLIFTLLLAPLLAAADPCARCNEMGTILKSGDLLAEQQYLSNFQLSSDPIQAALEAESVTQLALHFLPLDREEDSRAFYYGIFKQRPEVMKAALKRLPLKEERYLTNIYDEYDRLMKHGNGALDAKQK